MENLASILEAEIIHTNFIIYICVFACIFILTVILIFKLILGNKKSSQVILTKKQENYKKLKAINLNNNDYKKILYDFTTLGKTCQVNELKDEFYLILENIEKYKYQTDCIKIDKLTISQMEEYIQKLGSYELV